MLEFKIIQELKPNKELLEIIKNYNYTANTEFFFPSQNSNFLA